VSSLEGLNVGDALVVIDQQRRPHHRKVAKIGRVWVFDDFGSRFGITDGAGAEREQYGYGFRAMSQADWEARDEKEQLERRLALAGWVPRPPLSLAQLRRAAALLSEFDSERTGGAL
jgi:hypothetical protein